MMNKIDDMMKSIALFICTFLCLEVSAQKVDFKLQNKIFAKDGREAPIIKNIEKNVSLFLSAINKGKSNKLAIDTLCTSKDAAAEIKKTWNFKRFKTRQKRISSKIMLTTQRFMVRDIAIKYTSKDHKNMTDTISVLIASNGKIEGLYKQLPSNIMQGSRSLSDVRCKLSIIEFIEEYKTNLGIKNPEWINKCNSTFMVQSDNGKWNKKADYVEMLKNQMGNVTYPDIIIEDLNIKQNKAIGKEHIYFARFKQTITNRDKDNPGYVGMLFDFKDKKKYQIHIITYQPTIINGKPIPEEEIFTMGDFYVD